MSLRSIALSTALLLGLGGFCLAQDSGPYGPQYPVYQQPYPNAGSPAYQRGYNDGVNDGRKDWQNNHNFRSTGTEKYEDAPGYDKAYGIDKKQYQAIYREGYVAGYQQSYNQPAGQVAPAYPQAPVYGQQGYPVYGAGQPNNPAYQLGFQDGVNDGQQDRQSAHAFRPMATEKYDDTPGYNKSWGLDKDQFKQFYRQGYTAGYQQGYGWNPAYGQAPYPVYGPQGYPVASQPPYISTQGYQMGYQDGMTDGRNDRQAGKAYRATGTEKYEDAPGYNKSLGDKNAYKAAYRQGYVAGYQAAFNGPVH